MHEGGHAAHFANIEQGSPLFSQERAPFSVSLAETQSMFLDSLSATPRAGPIRQGPIRVPHSLGPAGEVHPGEAPFRGVHAPRHDRRALL